jgi:hypothetical protein
MEHLQSEMSHYPMRRLAGEIRGENLGVDSSLQFCFESPYSILLA